MPVKSSLRDFINNHKNISAHQDHFGKGEAMFLSFMLELSADDAEAQRG